MCVRLSTDVQIGVALVERISCSTCSVEESECADHVYLGLDYKPSVVFAANNVRKVS